MSVHDTQNPESRDDALQAAVDAVRDGGLIVLPTDTVYGIGADAFTPDAVQALLDAKGRGRDTPPTWVLGEPRGTVALRMPDDETARELLRRAGPLAVSSANRHGKPAALTVLDAATQLGDAVEVYLDGGTARLGTSSTIVDATVTPAVILRKGSITQEQIVALVGDVFSEPEPEPDPEAEEEGGSADDASAVDPTDAADAPAEEGSAAAEAAPATDAAAGEDPAADEPVAAASALDLPAEAEISPAEPAEEGTGEGAAARPENSAG